MADDNVVRGMFGQRKTIGSQTPSAVPHSLGETLRSLKDGPMGGFLREAGMTATLQLLEMQEHLNSLRGYVPSKAQIGEQEEFLKDHTEAELVTLIENSGASDWNIKPAFYQAIINVYRQGKF